MPGTNINGKCVTLVPVVAFPGEEITKSQPAATTLSTSTTFPFTEQSVVEEAIVAVAPEPVTTEIVVGVRYAKVPGVVGEMGLALIVALIVSAGRAAVVAAANESEDMY